ncbi:hypothetical protein [Neobacillus sp. PS3-40]|uniref:hypothetical protein n=1 Tax=Neobacillus sp. PS3-40 TaxID=3070679 RepID=UPI0027E02162|nr:hypothetical protein [Neobacillus sp. PS3-40]WML44432.1 hypothetical protein RCG20_00500 [Neobacillus sp. PS3-40]
MKENFSKLFWGFFLIFIEIHIIKVDLLPDPLGYLLIFLGIKALSKGTLVGKKAQAMAMVLIFVSLPTIFIYQNGKANEFAQILPLDGWNIYMNALGVLKIMLVFYIFKIMLSLVNERSEIALVKRTTTTFHIYIVVMLSNFFLQSFTMNVGTNMLQAITSIMIVSSTIVEIIFLVLLRRYMKIQENINPEAPGVGTKVDIKV